MKRVLFIALAVITFIPAAFAGDKNKKAPAKKTSVDAVDDKEIHWLTWDEVQMKMREKPKKVWVDIYTDWCGWCKRMDATTFKDHNLIRYMNEKFYAVRFNAEKQDSIMFMGKLYTLKPEYKANELAVQLMHGQMAYPTGIIMEENFQNPQPVPGYHGVSEMEMILKYLGENTYKTEKFDEYQKTFKSTWGG